jgi:HSP20 family protein
MFDLIPSNFMAQRGNLQPNRTQNTLSSFFDEMTTVFSKFDMLDSSFGKLNTYSDKDNSVIEVQIPGVSKEDIEINLKDGMLHISAEQKVENVNDDKNYHVKEFSYSSFNRSISVPKDLTEEDINASFENGILKIELPKKEIENKNVKRIEIK